MGKSLYHTPPSEEQQEQFLEHVAAGLTKQEAAEKVGATSTQFRTFINGKGEASVAFAERYAAILEAIGQAPSPLAARIRELEGVQIAHRILDEYLLRALDGERKVSPSSNRLLYQLALLKVDDFKPLLEARTRHIHEGAVGIYAMPQIDTSRWTMEQHREFVALRQRMNELISVAKPDDQPALPPGSDEDVIDVAAVEEVEAA